ncbi:hypothetical protein, partial [Burkholderia sp. Bp8963]|uniref:hypothetical protein n=1 Tax=Burkholderia sp. Bp8963 TaxID=2184547 RepID=UPI001C894A9A
AAICAKPSCAGLALRPRRSGATRAPVAEVPSISKANLRRFRSSNDRFRAIKRSCEWGQRVVENLGDKVSQQLKEQVEEAVEVQQEASDVAEATSCPLPASTYFMSRATRNPFAE